jgi:hypothetical protein
MSEMQHLERMLRTRLSRKVLVGTISPRKSAPGSFQEAPKFRTGFRINEPNPSMEQTHNGRPVARLVRTGGAVVFRFMANVRRHQQTLDATYGSTSVLPGNPVV